MPPATDIFGIVGTTQAGTYRVESVVAEGGFSLVYKAFHEAFRAPVALKCLKVPTAMSPDHQAEFLEKFRSEGELLFRLSASLPAVVRPLHVDALTTAAGIFVPFMALEWLTGETLGRVITKRSKAGQPPFTIDELVPMLTPVARALARAHNFPTADGQISIVHRDLKPENIFIADVHGERVVKVLDFGIAKAKSAATQIVGQQSQHASSLTAFSPRFAAPEQWVPKRFGQTGPWTDVYSLALTMVEVLYGRKVLSGEASEMMAAALDEDVRPSPKSRKIAVSDAVERVFLRALAVNPAERYPHAGTFWDDLEGALGLGRSVPPPLDVDSSEPPPDPTQMAPAGAPPPPPVPIIAMGGAALDIATPVSTTPISQRTPISHSTPISVTGETTPLNGPQALSATGTTLGGKAPLSARGPIPMMAPQAPKKYLTAEQLRSDPPIDEVDIDPRTLAKSLLFPAMLMLAGLCVIVAANQYAGENGEVPMALGIPITLPGKLLALIGIGWGVYQLVRARKG